MILEISSPGGSVVKNLPAKREAWIWSQGREDPLEEEMATPSSILAWEILWTKEPGGLQCMGSRSQTWLSLPLILEIRSRNRSHWAKNQGVIGFILSGGSESFENPFPCLFQLLEATHSPFLHFQIQHSSTFQSLNSDLLPCSVF